MDKPYKIEAETFTAALAAVVMRFEELHTDGLGQMDLTLTNGSKVKYTRAKPKKGKK